jgi:hypothetical protein
MLFCGLLQLDPNQALNLLVTDELLSTLLYEIAYVFLHNLLNVLVQMANKVGLQQKIGRLSSAM